jgi:AcrR family transcriptional regulator
MSINEQTCQSVQKPRGAMSNRNQDRRGQRTRHLLSAAFVQLMREKGYSAITVSDLIERANIGRSTFYSHYRDKDDLFVHELDRVIEVLSSGIQNQEEMPFFQVWDYSVMWEKSMNFIKHWCGRQALTY